MEHGDFMKVNFKNLLKIIILVFEGILVGFGAIMPGISGGTLCVAFGMYQPIISVLSTPVQNIRVYWQKLLFFVLGVGLGFIGLSGLAGFLLAKNATIVICAFVGFIIGTLPSLWTDSGKTQRTSKSYVSLAIGFVFMLTFLFVFKSQSSLSLGQNFLGYLICGVFWGLSFIVPGLSSSTLIIFFGLYESMLNGISSLDFSVIIPLALGAVICVLLLSKLINTAFEKHHSILSHAILGIMIATTIMILPPLNIQSFSSVVFYFTSIILGAVISYTLTKLCQSLEK